MPIDHALLQRFMAECSGPPDLISTVGGILLDQVAIEDRRRERDFTLRVAGGMVPAPAPWSKARAIHAEMVKRSGDDGPFRETVRTAVRLSGGVLGVRQIYRILKDAD